MSSSEYNRRHYGIKPDEQPQARASVPTNIQRRTGAVTGIYETPSNPVPMNADAPPSPSLVSLIPQTVDTWAVDAWKKGTSGLSASGEKLISPVAVMPVQKGAKPSLVVE